MYVSYVALTSDDLPLTVPALKEEADAGNSRGFTFLCLDCLFLFDRSLPPATSTTLNGQCKERLAFILTTQRSLHFRLQR